MERIGKLLTPKEAAEILGISPSTLMHWLRQNKLKGVKVGKYWRISEDEIREFIKKGGFRKDE